MSTFITVLVAVMAWVFWPLVALGVALAIVGLVRWLTGRDPLDPDFGLEDTQPIQPVDAQATPPVASRPLSIDQIVELERWLNMPAAPNPRRLV